MAGGWSFVTSGLKATATTLLSCFSGRPRVRLSPRPKPRAVNTARGNLLAVGAEDNGTYLPSCFMGWPSGWPVVASHSRAVLS